MVEMAGQAHHECKLDLLLKEPAQSYQHTVRHLALMMIPVQEGGRIALLRSMPLPLQASPQSRVDQSSWD